jgi:tetratricopeptide (TPR) repeat protein
VRRVGGRLRVSAELVRAAGGAQVWGQQFDQAGDDIFAVQEEVARDVATGIVGRLLPAERQALAVRPTESAAAYQAFLRGNVHLARRDSAGIRRAIEEYESALQADPAYTAALSRVALAYGIAFANGINPGFPRDTLLGRAIRSADAAVRRAPGSSEAWLAMGLARLAAQPGQPQASRTAFERAIELDGTNAEAHHMLGFALAILGQDSAGLEQDRMALAIEPARPVTLMHLAQYASKIGRYAEARRWVDSALAIDRDFNSARGVLPVLMLAMGDSAGARAEVSRWPYLQATSAFSPLAALALAPHGTDSAAVAAWRAALRGLLPGELPVLQSGFVALLLQSVTRDPATVVPALEAARPRGAFLHYFMTWTAFDPIREDPRFQQLFRETTP